MKEKILELRATGLSYKQICEKLKCSKSIISYYCGKGQKEKSKKRAQDRRKNTVISKRVEHFRKLKDKSEDFQRKRLLHKGKRKLGKRSLTFSWQDVVNKFGWETICYLTGRSIKLKEPKTYQFDHIIPYGRGGNWTLDNLGIVCKEANQAKSDMTVEELLDLCKEILEHHGYEINKWKV